MAGEQATTIYPMNEPTRSACQREAEADVIWEHRNRQCKDSCGGGRRDSSLSDAIEQGNLAFYLSLFGLVITRVPGTRCGLNSKHPLVTALETWKSKILVLADSQFMMRTLILAYR